MVWIQGGKSYHRCLQIKHSTRGWCYKLKSLEVMIGSKMMISIFGGRTHWHLESKGTGQSEDAIQPRHKCRGQIEERDANAEFDTWKSILAQVHSQSVKSNWSSSQCTVSLANAQCTPHFRLNLEAITFFCLFTSCGFFAFEHFKMDAWVPAGITWSLRTTAGFASTWVSTLKCRLELNWVSSVGWSWIGSLGSVEVKLLVVQLRQVGGSTMGSWNQKE